MTQLHGFSLHVILYLPELYVYHSAILEKFLTTRSLVDFSFKQFLRSYFFILPSKVMDKPVMLLENCVVL